MKLDDKVIEFFKTEIDELGVLLSEDFYFCRRWQNLGGKVYAAPWVRITHAGEYEFAGNFVKNIFLQARIEQEAQIAETPVESKKKSNKRS